MCTNNSQMIGFSRAAVCAFFAVCFVAYAIAGTTPEGKAWLAMKEKEAGVVATGSGLLYKVLKSGAEGAKKPRVDTPCECHYKGTLIDGREFDSSYSRGTPATFAPNQVIKGWTEAMQMMKEGDHWELYIPSELAYGDANRSAPRILMIYLLRDTGAEAASSPQALCSFLNWRCSRSRTKHARRVRLLSLRCAQR